jgi:hypothetical protein
MKKLSFIVGVCVLITCDAAPTIRPKLVVTDFDGQPVFGANVDMGIREIMPAGPLGAPTNIVGNTNSQGVVEGVISSPLGSFGALVRKNGYYATMFTLDNWAGRSSRSEDYTKDHWEPWERTISVVLRPIKNPVPMYAKHVVAFLPILSAPVGFDLERGDWVVPYGNGVRADWEFWGEGYIKGASDYDGILTLRLPGNNNGIQVYDYPKEQRSELKLPYEAPVMGYASSWRWRSACGMKKEGSRLVNDCTNESYPDRGFIYRVRTKVDEKGRVIEAWHGKIYGPVVFSPRLTGRWAIKITYYFNPDGTRNLEFDPSKNLFPKEGIREP